MKFAGLFSSGKDSTYSIYSAIKKNHDLRCVIIIRPKDDESLLYHHPNNHILRKIAGVLEVPIIEVSCEATDKISEINCLKIAIREAVDQHNIEGLCHGCINSEFQFKIFGDLAHDFNLKLLSPLWNIDTDLYYSLLFNDNFEIILTKVAANGLDRSWLGKRITADSLKYLKSMSLKYGFNLNFEGGEAETLVLNCPIYKKRIRIRESRIIWDGIRGIFEISDVDLIEIKRPNA